MKISFQTWIAYPPIYYLIMVCHNIKRHFLDTSTFLLEKEIIKHWIIPDNDHTEISTYLEFEQEHNRKCILNETLFDSQSITF